MVVLRMHVAVSLAERLRKTVVSDHQHTRTWAPFALGLIVQREKAAVASSVIGIKIGG